MYKNWSTEEEEFESVDHGILRGIELYGISDIEELAMRDGWGNSSVIFIGLFEIEDSDDVYLMFKDMKTNLHYFFSFE